MRLYHGTDDPNAVSAWINHSLRPSMYGSDIDLLDGCEDNPFGSEDGVVSLTQLRSTAERYARVALIEIEVDEDVIYQTASDEYQMLVNAQYEIIDVTTMDGSTFTMHRLAGGDH